MGTTKNEIVTNNQSGRMLMNGFLRVRPRPNNGSFGQPFATPIKKSTERFR
jgi:hypothetical protein